MSAIGAELGFSSQSSFTRFFSSNVGLAPTLYRRIARAVPPLVRLTPLLDFVPGVARHVGHMMFVAARPA